MPAKNQYGSRCRTTIIIQNAILSTHIRHKKVTASRCECFVNLLIDCLENILYAIALETYGNFPLECKDNTKR